VFSSSRFRQESHQPQGKFEDANAPPQTGIYVYRYDAEGDATRPQKLNLMDSKLDAANFHPLGIELDEANDLLYVVNHAEAGSQIEVFKLFLSEVAATHVRSIKHSQLHTPNSVLLLSPNELLVTNDHYFRKRYNPIFATLETYLGIPGGSLTYVKLPESPDQQVEVTELARIPFANGVAVINDTTVAVASSASAAVFLYNAPSGLRNGGAKDLQFAETFTLPFLPDNLSVDENHKLLIAGHVFAPAIEAVAQNSARCNTADADKQGCEVRAPSGVAEWSSADGLKVLYTGYDFQSSTTAVRDVRRGFGIVTGLYEKGILTWSEK
jgi:arylesterase / paraoxonase